MKKRVLVFLTLAFLSVSCTIDKTPLQSNLSEVNPEGTFPVAFDLRDMDGNDAIMQKIDRLRGQVRDMCEDDQKKSMTYVQNLTKLSNLY